MTTKKLTRRQARQALTLSKYNFEIIYRLGKQNSKADTLTRKLGDRPEGDQDNRQREQFQTILPTRRLYPDLRRELKNVSEQEELVQESVATVAAMLSLKDDDEEELPKILKLRVREAQLEDQIYKRVIKKLKNKDR